MSFCDFQLWFSGLGSVKGLGFFGFPIASGCFGMLLGGALRFGLFAEQGTQRSTSEISIGSPSPGMVWANHHSETVSTPPQDFAARRMRTREPLSCPHPFRHHPFRTCLRFDSLQALAAEVEKPLGPVFVIRLFALFQA